MPREFRAVTAVIVPESQRRCRIAAVRKGATLRAEVAMAQARKQRRVRRFLLGLVISALFFFIVGYIAVKYGYWHEGPYLMIATIVGGTASLIGMLSLARPSISADDIENIELEALGRVSDVAKQLEDARRAQAETKGELEQLELQRAQMEASVRRAATVLFLREKIARQQERLTEKLRYDAELMELVNRLQADYEQLAAAGEEITSDPNVEVLSEVISRMPSQRHAQSSLLGVVMDVAEQMLGKVIR